MDRSRLSLVDLKTVELPSTPVKFKSATHSRQSSVKTSSEFHFQDQNDVIELRLSRSNQLTNSIVSIADKLLQPQALYTEFQRRPNLMQSDAISNSSSRSGSNNSDKQLKTIHVTLYKDQVYDNNCFSMSDELYERRVYINRIRSGGLADQISVLKPYDRISQVSFVELPFEINFLQKSFKFQVNGLWISIAALQYP